MQTYHYEKKEEKDETKFTKFINFLIYWVAFLGPMMMFPQVIRVWQTRVVENLSLITWIFFLFMAIIWTIYGFIHKDKPIIIANFIWIIVDIFMIIAIFLF